MADGLVIDVPKSREKQNHQHFCLFTIWSPLCHDRRSISTQASRMSLKYSDSGAESAHIRIYLMSTRHGWPHLLEIPT